MQNYAASHMHAGAKQGKNRKLAVISSIKPFLSHNPFVKIYTQLLSFRLTQFGKKFLSH